MVLKYIRYRKPREENTIFPLFRTLFNDATRGIDSCWTLTCIWLCVLRRRVLLQRVWWRGMRETQVAVAAAAARPTPAPPRRSPVARIPHARARTPSTVHWRILQTLTNLTTDKNVSMINIILQIISQYREYWIFKKKSLNLHSKVTHVFM